MRIGSLLVPVVLAAAAVAYVGASSAASPGWTVERAADMLWALISTEPLERLLMDRGWESETYAELFAQLLRSTFVARSRS